MRAIKDQNFIDAPSILTELVKFLTLHTEFDSIKELTV